MEFVSILLFAHFSADLLHMRAWKLNNFYAATKVIFSDLHILSWKNCNIVNQCKKSLAFPFTISAVVVIMQAFTNNVLNIFQHSQKCWWIRFCYCLSLVYPPSCLPSVNCFFIVYLYSSSHTYNQIIKEFLCHLGLLWHVLYFKWSCNISSSFTDTPKRISLHDRKNNFQC